MPKADFYWGGGEGYGCNLSAGTWKRRQKGLPQGDGRILKSNGDALQLGG